MALPFFYKEDITLAATDVLLDEATSKHIVQVLRMQNGEQLQLTNGKGVLFTCEIKDNNRKKCAVSVVQQSEINNPKSEIVIAISLLKNTTRFEWFLEKATEIGVAEIVPLICERTEKTAFKMERMKSILVSAMLQSQQCWLPVLQEPVKYANMQMDKYTNMQKLIAHCENEANKEPLTNKLINGLTPEMIGTFRNKLILIGPEGDFTKQEIEWALKNSFMPVSLGNTRLRTETAGVVAATLLCISG
jgi:16S rRNA (uracil1498-N3)-methyltransferase